jgi:hypothetical protein
VDDVVRSPESETAASVAENARSAGKAGSTDRPPADPQSVPEPVFLVLTGSRAGSRIALTKRETLIGRAGVQVAALRNDAGIVRLVPVEGSIPPNVNGVPVTAEGRPLAPGDILEMVGARLEFMVS